MTLPLKNPFLAAPILYEGTGGNICHLAPFAPGVPLDQDVPRSLPKRLEIAHHAACNWTSCEDLGYFHGDIRLPHLLISKSGSVSLIDHDNFGIQRKKIPAPPMAGDRMMMAPELKDLIAEPTIESDRFAYAVWFHMLLFQVHPSDGNARTPAEMDTVMGLGKWPGHKQGARLALTDSPLQAVGSEIVGLFDSAFALDPKKRPTADDWRRAFVRAIKCLVRHECGQYFAIEKADMLCPRCKERVHDTSRSLQIEIALTGIRKKYSLTLRERRAITIGRANLGHLSRELSPKHLELFKQGEQIHLRHIGQAKSSIRYKGKWYRLDAIWWPISRLLQEPLELRLGNVSLSLNIRNQVK